ncbi:hypothetical protein [Paraflavitalea sp. CAU 1676]|uniref:hypothetical protein n=1 Tax=Paraflavitalea sp. CAU 1676 TaxID=3032598 RepID=UPI0023DA4EEF|nr:hypothetical protein [Paraflavitalea sp. CAU 1676]MDF2188908.1 hypothetical protein [Paraflavitalea sp. CAU 1676]
MPSKNKIKEKKIGNAIISDKVRDYGNDPYFVKKTRESKEFLKKHGFPKELLEKR